MILLLVSIVRAEFLTGGEGNLFDPNQCGISWSCMANIPMCQLGSENCAFGKKFKQGKNALLKLSSCLETKWQKSWHITYSERVTGTWLGCFWNCTGRYHGKGWYLLLRRQGLVFVVLVGMLHENSEPEKTELLALALSQLGHLRIPVPIGMHRMMQLSSKILSQPQK